MRNLGLSPLKLGLDLRGGVYLVYQVDVQGAVRQLLDHHEQDFRASLRNARIPYQDVQVDYAQDRVRVLFRDADSFAKGRAAILADNRNLALDGHHRRWCAGAPTGADAGRDPGARGLCRPAEHRHPAQPAQQPELAVSEPQVARQGVDRITIQLPGLQNSAEVKKILGKVATLEFRMVDETDNPLEAAATGRVPLGSKLYYTPGQAAGAAEARSDRHRRSAHRCLVPAQHPGRAGGVDQPGCARRGPDAEEHAARTSVI